MPSQRKLTRTPLPRLSPRALLSLGIVAAVLLVIPVFVTLTTEEVRAFLDFGSGVLSLVSLTSAVVWGLLARDRRLLGARQRLIAQGVHRTTAVASLAFLLLHVTTKIALERVELIGALLPFGLGLNSVSVIIGLGSIAGYLMIFTAATGVLRSTFAVPGQVAGRWRAMHSLSYPAWGAGLVHGLYAGRQADTWITVLYSLSVVAVGLAVSLRLLPVPLRRRIAARLMSVTQPEALEPSAIGFSGPAGFSTAPLPEVSPRELSGGFGVGTPLSIPPGSEAPTTMIDPVRDMPFGAGAGPGFGAGAAPDYASSGFAGAGQSFGAGPAQGTGQQPAGFDHGAPRSPAPGSPGMGSGISAAYRAVSNPSPPTPSQGFPQPVIPEQATPASGRWPAPSPSPPGDYVRPEAAPQPAWNTTPDPLTDPLPEQPAQPIPNPLFTDPFAASGQEAGADPGSGPYYPPTPGEPWHEPARERP